MMNDRRVPSMKKSRMWFVMVIFVLGIVFPGCAPQTVSDISSQDVETVQTRPEKKYADLIIGYAQIGAESEWRAANTLSIKDTAEKLGVELRFLDAQQKQENQILAIRKFIIQKVDVIGISPIVETGW